MAHAGAYRRRVDIQWQKLVQDSTGSAVPTWKTRWYAVPCSILVYRGNEGFDAAQVDAYVTFKVTFRYRPDIDATMRLVEHLPGQPDTLYNIEAVYPDISGRRDVTVLCKVRLTEGFRSDGG